MKLLLLLAAAALASGALRGSSARNFRARRSSAVHHASHAVTAPAVAHTAQAQAHAAPASKAQQHGKAEASGPYYVRPIITTSSGRHVLSLDEDGHFDSADMAHHRDLAVRASEINMVHDNILGVDATEQQASACVLRLREARIAPLSPFAHFYELSIPSLFACPFRPLQLKQELAQAQIKKKALILRTKFLKYKYLEQSAAAAIKHIDRSADIHAAKIRGIVADVSRPRLRYLTACREWRLCGEEGVV